MSKIFNETGLGGGVIFLWNSPKVCLPFLNTKSLAINSQNQNFNTKYELPIVEYCKTKSVVSWHKIYGKIHKGPYCNSISVVS